MKKNPNDMPHDPGFIPTWPDASPEAASPPSASPGRIHQRSSHIRERLFDACIWMAGCFSIGAVLAILGFLVYFSWPLAASGQVGQILSFSWQPFQGQFGIGPMILGSLALGTSALALAFPMGLGVLMFALGLGPKVLQGPVAGLIRFMTSIPTVVYGFVAVFVLTPFLRQGFAGTGYSWLAALLGLAILILPTIVLIMETQMRGIEEHVRLTAAALGLTPVQTLVSLVLPLSRKGLIAAAALGFGRAVGDTIIPLMLAGNAPRMPGSLVDSIRTLTAHIALVVATDSQSPAYLSVFASGLILFGITVAINLLIRKLGRWDSSSG